MIGYGTLNTTPVWFFSSSLCLQLVITYTSKTGQMNGDGVTQTFYRIETINARASVNSGTMIQSRMLHMGCIGFTETGVTHVWNPTYNITSDPNPYTTTIMSSQPYVSSLLAGTLGVTFECTAKRSSGNVGTFEVNCSLFSN